MPTRTQRPSPAFHPHAAHGPSAGPATRSAAAAVPGASGRATTPRQALPSRSPCHPCSTHGCRPSLTPPSPCGTLGAAAGRRRLGRRGWRWCGRRGWRWCGRREWALGRPALVRRRGHGWLPSASTARVGVGEPPARSERCDLARRVAEQIGAPDPQVNPPEALQLLWPQPVTIAGAAHRGVARSVRLHGDEHAGRGGRGPRSRRRRVARPCRTPRGQWPSRRRRSARSVRSAFRVASGAAPAALGTEAPRLGMRGSRAA